MVLTSQEEEILESINVPSDNDPQNPEFPPDRPTFPATPIFRIQVKGFPDVWLKDESVNPTGTHKDRMAWEIVVTYRDFLIAKKNNQYKGDLPQFSLISNGTAALAIQTMLKKFNLPNLKVIVDVNMERKMIGILKTIGCELYPAELSRKSLEWKEILALTHNTDGFDLTSNTALDPTIRFYDWLSYEIINTSPDYVFVPFGTGNLYENILNINKREISSFKPDPRFSGDIERLRHCNFLGATTNNPKTKADKLYSPHLPFLHFDEQWIRFYKQNGFCGQDSNVHLIKEEFIDNAMDIVDYNGIQSEHSGIAGLALMLQLRDKLPRRPTYLIINTGKTKLPSD